MNRPAFMPGPARRRLARAVPLAAGLGRRIWPVAVLPVVAAALLAPLAGAAPASAKTDTNCGFTASETSVGTPTQLNVQIILPERGTATGTVTFSEGTTTLGAVPLSGNIADLPYTFPAAGSYPVKATYSGDTNFSGCTGTGTATVDPATTSTTVTSSPNPSTPGQQVTFTAAVDTTSGHVTPTGTVTFSEGTTTLGTGTLTAPGGTSPTATFTTSALTPGPHQITASYGGDVNDTGSTSPPVTQTVTPPDTDLAISTPANITADATGPSGAAVSYQLPAVSDPGDATAPTPACSPAPGTTFAIGTTTVTCSATDPDDTPSTASSSFTITVHGAAAQLAALGQAVHGAGPGTSLTDKITAAQSYLASGDTADACSTLTLFINQVKAQSGKTIPAGQATQLITSATRIQAVLAC
jgi:hypothetical protein